VLGATHPAAAAAALAALASTVTCATTTACITGNNTSTGAGVAGTSSKGIGVTGTGKTGVSATGSAIGVKATGTNGYGVLASSTGTYGVFGSSVSGGAGVVGTTPSRYGVYGYTTGSSGGYGVYGASTNGYGVYGATTSGSGIGVIGYETGDGTGTYGFSGTGFGAEGITSDGYGLVGEASGTGTGLSVSANTGYGVIASTSGSVAFYGRNSGGNGSDIQGSYIGLLGRAPASGAFPLVLTDTSSNDLFYVDGAGNVSYHGGLFHFARTAGGATVKSFSPNSTLPTVEDTGTAQLAGGAAAVRLDPTFAASIDAGSSYRVFLTPNGDTRGLFVAAKTPNGFFVHEAQGGRSTVTFDYRIVATALGQAGQRMAVTSEPAAPRAAAPLVSRPASLQLPAAAAHR